jgi:hypothetical protein
MLLSLFQQRFAQYLLRLFLQGFWKYLAMLYSYTDYGADIALYVINK